MDQATVAKVGVICFVGALILTAYSLSMPWYEITGDDEGTFYVAGPGNMGRLSDRIQLGVAFWLFFGWTYLIARYANMRGARLLSGWFTLISALGTMAYFVTEVGDATGSVGFIGKTDQFTQTTYGPSTGWFAALFSLMVLAVIVVADLWILYSKPAPEPDSPLGP